MVSGSALDSKVWGPHYWFFLHTISLTYPHHPNAIVKKKYYDFLSNLDLFLPKYGKEYKDLLLKYPLAPFLDNRDSLVKWMNFIHNKVNERLEKKQESMNGYYEQLLKTPQPYNRRFLFFLVLIFMLVCIAILFYYR
jgi:hypothetical protein